MRSWVFLWWKSLIYKECPSSPVSLKAEGKTQQQSSQSHATSSTVPRRLTALGKLLVSGPASPKIMIIINEKLPFWDLPSVWAPDSHPVCPCLCLALATKSTLSGPYSQLFFFLALSSLSLLSASHTQLANYSQGSPSFSLSYLMLRPCCVALELLLFPAIAISKRLDCFFHLVWMKSAEYTHWINQVCDYIVINNPLLGSRWFLPAWQ